MRSLRLGCMVILLAGLGMGCARPLVRTFSPDVYRAENRLAVAEIGSQAYDQEMYVARSRYRHRIISSDEGAEPMALYAGAGKAQPEIIDASGYVNGLPVIFINDAGTSLRVEVFDPHGQAFLFSIDAHQAMGFSLETGPHHIRSFRPQRTEPFSQGTMTVWSDKVFWYQGQGYNGFVRFYGSRF